MSATVRIPHTAKLPRRVRLVRIIQEPIGRDPHPRPVALIEYPRITSTCRGRAPLWEWRLDHAFSIGRTS